MGVFKGKRKRGMFLTFKKTTSYKFKHDDSPLACSKKQRRLTPETLKFVPISPLSANTKTTSTPSNNRLGLKSLWSISPFRAIPQSCRKQIDFSIIQDECENEIDDLSMSIRSLDISTENVVPSISDEVNELNNLLPSVLEELDKVGKRDVITKFARLIQEKKLPLENISFLSFCDVLNWFSSDDTRGMRYSEETVKFFWVGQKLFGGRFLRFMSGMKNETEQLRGGSSFDAIKSRINFACPDEKMLREYNPFGDELPYKFSPGIMSEMIDYKSKKTGDSQSFVLMFDGKKIKRGTDVDLFGYEDGLTLKQKQDSRENNIRVIEALTNCIQSIQLVTDDVSNTPKELKPELLNNLVATNLMLSKLLEELRQVKGKKEYAMKKLKDKVDGEDWKKSKFAFSIDICRTIIWKIENVIDRITSIQKNICKTGAFVNNVGHLFPETDVVDLLSQENLRMLKSPENIPLENQNDFATTKQRTTKWYEERSKMKVTGSSIYKALGCDGLKRQKEHFASVISGEKLPEPTPAQAAAMEHGTISEIHQIASMCGIIMPFLFPQLTFYEEGFYVTDEVLVSPDGSLRSSSSSDDIVFAFEGKAPIGNPYKPTLHYQVPERYISQTLFEQKALSAEATIYLCWTSSSCTLFKVLKSESTIKALQDEIENVYFCPSPKCPTRLSGSAKELKESLQNVSKSRTIFLGEFPSVNGHVGIIEEESDGVYIEPRRRHVRETTLSFDEVLRHLLHCKDVVNEAYEFQRNIASQVVVFC